MLGSEGEPELAPKPESGNGHEQESELDQELQMYFLPGFGAGVVARVGIGVAAGVGAG